MGEKSYFRRFRIWAQVGLVWERGLKPGVEGSSFMLANSIMSSARWAQLFQMLLEI